MATQAPNDARAAIGEPASADYELAPQTHADALPLTAGALARVLRRKTIEPVVKRYLHEDRAALRSQFWFRWFSRLSVWMRLATVLLGALALVISLDVYGFSTLLDRWMGQAGLGQIGRLSNFLMFLLFSCLFLAAAAGRVLAFGRLFERWMAHRGAAETARLEFFYRVTGAHEPLQPGETDLLPLQLEYFRRHQFDVQSAYFQRRGEQHAIAAGQTRRARMLNTVLTFLALAPVLYGAAEFFRPSLLGRYLTIDASLDNLFVALGMAAAGIGGAIAEFSRLNLHQRNALRFAQVSNALAIFGGEPLETARAAAAAGDRASVTFFVDTIQGIVASEHQEWSELWKLRQMLRAGRE